MACTLIISDAELAQAWPRSSLYQLTYNFKLTYAPGGEEVLEQRSIYLNPYLTLPRILWWNASVVAQIIVLSTMCEVDKGKGKEIRG
jgi:hypothetical protein